MEVFNHIKTVLSIILGLGIGALLNGTVRFIQHPKRNKPFFVHFLLVVYLFLLIIHFWWWEYRLKTVEIWTFTQYVFTIFYIINFFILCQLLYPTDLNDYENDYKKYFFSRKKWFFLFFILLFFSDLIDTLYKGTDYLQSLMPLYGLRLATHTPLLLWLIFSKSHNKWLYGGAVSFFIIFELFFIYMRYYHY